MDNLRLPDKNTATTNSFEVFLKALGGFALGLLVAVWKVPGVPEAISSYVQQNWMSIILTVGIPTALSTGIINLIFDIRKKGLKNY